MLIGRHGKGTCCNGRVSSEVLHTQADETACHLEISFQNKGYTVRENTKRIFWSYWGKNENRNKKQSGKAGLFFKHVEKKLLF